MVWKIMPNCIKMTLLYFIIGKTKKKRKVSRFANHAANYCATSTWTLEDKEDSDYGGNGGPIKDGLLKTYKHMFKK